MQPAAGLALSFNLVYQTIDTALSRTEDKTISVYALRWFLLKMTEKKNISQMRHVSLKKQAVCKTFLVNTISFLYFKCYKIAVMHRDVNEAH